MGAIPIVSFVAFSNTGKTTFIEKLIPELKARGVTVAVLKHDAHEFDIDKEGKDSWRMTRAGAAVTIVTSATKAAIMENRPVPVQDLLERIKDVDLIITEGYKYGDWPKIALERAGNGKPFPIPVEECIAVVTDIPKEAPVPVFSLEDQAAVSDFLIKTLLAEKMTKSIKFPSKP